jgi:hypothetical protein
MMTKMFHFLLIVTVMVALILPTSQNEVVLADSSKPLTACEGDLPLAECQALIDLYNATDGAHWTNNAGWLEPFPCSWFGIFCNLDGDHVNAIILSNNNLKGIIPPQLSDLTELGVLELQGNALTGSIPAGLSHLTWLFLFDNQLTGGIPAEVFQVNLNQIDLSDNQLEAGPIPSTLADATDLVSLKLRNCGLSGSLPAALWTLPVLQRLDLSGNSLSGVISPDISGLTKLTDLLLAGNQLSGSVPIWAT